SVAARGDDCRGGLVRVDYGGRLNLGSRRGSRLGTVRVAAQIHHPEVNHGAERVAGGDLAARARGRPPGGVAPGQRHDVRARVQVIEAVPVVAGAGRAQAVAAVGPLQADVVGARARAVVELDLEILNPVLVAVQEDDAADHADARIEVAEPEV